jgi:chromate reductase
MKRVAVLVGSLRTDSANKKLAKNFEALAEGRLEFITVDMNLPLFNEDLESDPPASVVVARDIVKSADVVLMITPEYNRGPSGVMKNAIDWLSRPSDDGALQGRKVAIAGAGGVLSTGPAQAHLRSVIGYLNMPYLGQPEFYFHITPEAFDESGKLTNQAFAKRYVDALVLFAER